MDDPVFSPPPRKTEKNSNTVMEKNFNTITEKINDNPVSEKKVAKPNFPSPDVLVDVPCVFFQSGSCKNGINCTNLHIKRGPQDYVDLDDEDEFDDYQPL